MPPTHLLTVLLPALLLGYSTFAGPKESPSRAGRIARTPFGVVSAKPARVTLDPTNQQDKTPPPRGNFTIEGLASGERLGGSVALSNTSLLIGVYRADRPIGVADLSTGLGAGTVQAHSFSGNGWSNDSVLSPGSDGRIVINEEDVADDAFGRSVDVDDTTAITGMPGDHQAAGWAGAGAVLTRSGSGWRVSTKLVPDATQFGVDSVAGWQVGRDVAIDGGIIALGAPKASFTDSNGQHWAEAGAVLIYRATGTGWAFEAMLTSTTPDHFEQFGLSVDIDAGMLVVGNDAA